MPQPEASSASANSGDHQRGASGDTGWLRRDVCVDGSAVDPVEEGGGLDLASRRPERECAITPSAIKAYVTKDFVADGRANGIVVHAAQYITERCSAIAHDAAAVEGRALSQTACKRIEDVFGWTKGSAGKARALIRGLKRVDVILVFDTCA